MKFFSILLVVFSCLITPQYAHGDVVFADEFNADTLESGWRSKRLPNVDLLLTKEPGRLCIQNNGPAATIASGSATTLSLPSPDKNFTMETQVVQVESQGRHEAGPTLFITLDTRDTIAWTYNRDHLFTNTAEGSAESSNAQAPPICLRIRRVSNSYIFESRRTTNEPWVGQKQMTVDGTPVNVGIMFPKGSYNYTAALGYFRLETVDSGNSTKVIMPAPNVDRAAKQHDFSAMSEISTITSLAPSDLVFTSPRGNLVAIYRKKSVEIWDYKLVTLVNTLQRNDKVITAMAFSPDGTTIALGYDSGRIEICNVMGDKSIKTIWNAQPIVEFLNYSPDGKWLVSACSRNKSLVVMKTDTYLELYRQIDTSYTMNIAFTPDSLSFGTVNWDSDQIRIRDSSTGKIWSTIKSVNTSPINWVSFSPDEKYVAGANYEFVSIWSIPSGKIARKIPTHSAYRVFYSPVENVLGAVNGDTSKQTVDFFNTDTGVLLKQIRVNSTATISYSPDGGTVLIASDTLTVWNVPILE